MPITVFTELWLLSQSNMLYSAFVYLPFTNGASVAKLGLSSDYRARLRFELGLLSIERNRTSSECFESTIV